MADITIMLISMISLHPKLSWYIRRPKVSYVFFLLNFDFAICGVTTLTGGSYLYSIRRTRSHFPGECSSLAITILIFRFEKNVWLYQFLGLNPNIIYRQIKEYCKTKSPNVARGFLYCISKPEQVRICVSTIKQK